MAENTDTENATTPERTWNGHGLSELIGVIPTKQLIKMGLEILQDREAQIEESATLQPVTVQLPREIMDRYIDALSRYQPKSMTTKYFVTDYFAYKSSEMIMTEEVVGCANESLKILLGVVKDIALHTEYEPARTKITEIARDIANDLGYTEIANFMSAFLLAYTSGDGLDKLLQGYPPTIK